MSDPHVIFGVTTAGRKGRHLPISVAVEAVIVRAGRPARAEPPRGRRDDLGVASGRRTAHRSRLDVRSAGSRRGSETGSRKLFGDRRFDVDHRLFGLRRIGRLSDRLALANRLTRTVHAIATHLLASVRLLGMDGHDPEVVLRMLLIVFSADMIPAGAGIVSQGAILVVNLSRRSTDLGVRAVALEAAVRTAAMRPATTPWAPTRTLVVYWSHIKVDFYFLQFRLAPAARADWTVRPVIRLRSHRPFATEQTLASDWMRSRPSRARAFRCDHMNNVVSTAPHSNHFFSMLVLNFSLRPEPLDIVRCRPDPA